MAFFLARIGGRVPNTCMRTHRLRPGIGAAVVLPSAPGLTCSRLNAVTVKVQRAVGTQLQQQKLAIEPRSWPVLAGSHVQLSIPIRQFSFLDRCGVAPAKRRQFPVSDHTHAGQHDSHDEGNQQGNAGGTSRRWVIISAACIVLLGAGALVYKTKVCDETRCAVNVIDQCSARRLSRQCGFSARRRSVR